MKTDMNTQSEKTRHAIDHRFEELAQRPTLETDNRRVHAYPWLLKGCEDGYALWIQVETKQADAIPCA